VSVSSGRTLVWIEGRYAICRLPPDAPAPELPGGAFLSISRTPEEVSLVCELAFAPSGARVEEPFALLRVTGSMDLGLTGVLASLAGPLAAAGIPVFAIATFDTDYILVPEAMRESTEAALIAAGHHFVSN